MTAIYSRPTICIPASKRDASYVSEVFKTRYYGTDFEVEGGPVETGKNVGKGFFAWFITYAPGKDSDFHPALLNIFDSIENGTGSKLELSTNKPAPFWHLCRSNFPNHNTKTELIRGQKWGDLDDDELDSLNQFFPHIVEPEILFGDFEHY